jgi:Raf kinase inhibitor-like YbhB/YbcL family protein
VINADNRRSVGRLLLATFLTLANISVPHQALATHASHFVLKSTDPQLTAHFPDKYVLNDFGCSGGNISPPLQWSGAPAGTLSYVVTLFDKDEHNTPSGWWHWVVYDIPAGVSGLPEGAGALHSAVLPRQAVQGRTDLGVDAYHGPCPDQGDAPHRYVFTIYALNIANLSVPADPSGAMVVATLREHQLGQAALVVRHGR